MKIKTKNNLCLEDMLEKSIAYYCIAWLKMWKELSGAWKWVFLRANIHYSNIQQRKQSFNWLLLLSDPHIFILCAEKKTS